MSNNKLQAGDLAKNIHLWTTETTKFSLFTATEKSPVLLVFFPCAFTKHENKVSTNKTTIENNTIIISTNWTSFSYECTTFYYVIRSLYIRMSLRAAMPKHTHILCRPFNDRVQFPSAYFKTTCNN